MVLKLFQRFIIPQSKKMTLESKSQTENRPLGLRLKQLNLRMGGQAQHIQKEVESLLLDVTRLDERIAKLRGHFDQANKDIEQIETSSRKIGSRGEKITSLEVEAESGSDLLDNKG